MTTIKTEIAGLEEWIQEMSLQVPNKNVRKWKMEKKYKRFKR